MISPDINILVAAHRPEISYHASAKKNFIEPITQFAKFSLCTHVCAGFIRIVTNHKIFQQATPLDLATASIQVLINNRNYHAAEPGPDHHQIFHDLLKKTNTRGPTVSDAYLAAICIENGSELLTNDADFARFPGLKIQRL